MGIAKGVTRSRCYTAGMPAADLTPPHETPRDLGRSLEVSQDPVEIPQDASITIDDGLAIAAAEQFSIGKSTLQRWAKRWSDLGAASPVKTVLVATRTGYAFRFHRDELTTWVLDQRNNQRPRGVSEDLARPRETSPETVVTVSASPIPAGQGSPPPQNPDASRTDAIEAATSKYVAALERENEFLRDQANRKDEQISNLSQRFSETQKLLAGVQRMLAPLLGQADPYRAPNASPRSVPATVVGERSHDEQPDLGDNQPAA